MAYDVTFTVPSRPLGKADVTFVVKDGDRVLGTLEVSKGAIVWYPKKTTYGCKATWQEFHRIAQQKFNRTETR